MAWKAKLVMVPQEVRNGAFDCEVEFYDLATGRSHRKTLNMYLGNVTSRADVRAITDAEVQKLKDLDRVQAILLAAVGEDV